MDKIYPFDPLDEDLVTRRRKLRLVLNLGPTYMNEIEVLGFPLIEFTWSIVRNKSADFLESPPPSGPFSKWLPCKKYLFTNHRVRLWKIFAVSSFVRFTTFTTIPGCSWCCFFKAALPLFCIFTREKPGGQQEVFLLETLQMKTVLRDQKCAKVAQRSLLCPTVVQVELKRKNACYAG